MLKSKTIRHGLSFLGMIAMAAFSTGAPAAETAAGRSASENAKTSRVVCAIRPYNGKPTMFVNGEPRFPMAFISYHPEQFRYRQVGEHGVHVYSVSLTLTDKWLNWRTHRVKHRTPGLWKGPGEIDFSTLEKCLREVLDVDPKALIFPRVYCDSPSWWDAAHPDQVRPIAEGRPLRQSFASTLWRNETAETLKKIVRFVANSEYGDHVIGYMIAAGDTEEWGDTASDFSPCAQNAFREWLKARYGNDEQTILRLFGSKIDAIAIPLEAGRRRTLLSLPPGQAPGDCGNFLDPAKSRLIIDYRQFGSDQMADSAIALCQAVKEASDGRLMTGLFYGCTNLWPDTGHLALRRVLDSPAIDFTSTASVIGGVNARQRVGNADFQSATQIAAVQKAGKLFYRESDVRTALSRWISELHPEVDPDGEYKQPGWLGPPTIKDTLELLKAVFAQVLVTGSANWWFDLWGGWYDHKEILELFARMQTVGEESIHQPRKSVAQIAVFVDENAYRYHPFAVAENVGSRFTWIRAQVGQLGKIGAPWDAYLLDDLKDLDLTPYRMVIFVNAFVLSDAQRQMIAERCMSDNRLLVWLYAPGLINDALAVKNVSSLLGMDVQMDAAHPAAKIRLEVPSGTITYQSAAVSPFLYVSGGADAVHGRTQNGLAVVAEKAGPNCRNLFVALPPLPWNALQQYAKQANVHLYSEAGDVIHANQHYLAISVAKAGKRTIRMPREVALKEILAFGEDEFFEKGSQFEMDFADHTSRIFRVVH